MKKLVFILLLLVTVSTSFAQLYIGGDGKVHSAITGGAVANSNEVTFVSDTTSFKHGFAKLGSVLYYYDGYWKILSSSEIAPISKGGTGDTTAPGARIKLGVPYAQVYDLVGKFIIACWGDSFTQGAGSSGGANLDYPNQLSNISGFSNYNGGIGGQSSGQIRDRMLADIPKHGYPTIIWAGRNDYTDTTNVKTYINDMVLALGNNPNYIVLSILNGSMGANEMKGGAGYNTIIALNKALERAYGSHYVDVRKTLVEAYNPAIPYDVYCYNQDIPPLSLRGDSLHLNDAGYLVVAKKVFENLSQLTNPVVHVGSINYLLKNPLKLNSTLQVDSTLTVLREINSGAISVTGGITSSGTREGFRINDDNAYVGFHNGAGTTRTGYLQFNAGGDVLLNGENATSITLASAPVKVLNQNFSVSGGSAYISLFTQNGIVTNNSSGLLSSSSGSGLVRSTAGIVSYDNSPYISNPLAFTGDMIYSSNLGTPARLAIGNGVLTGTGGTPSWTNYPTLEGVKTYSPYPFRSESDLSLFEFYNGAGTTRTGYLEFSSGADITLAANNATGIRFIGAPVTVLNQDFKVTGADALIGNTVNAGTGRLQVTGNASIVGNTNITGNENIIGNETVNGVLTVNNSGPIVNDGGDNGQYAIISGPNKVLFNGSNSGQLFVVANDPTPSANFGGSIGFGATFLNGTSAVAINAAIRSGRDDGTSGNYGGYFAIDTRPNGDGLQERLRVTSTGNTLIGSTSDAGTGKLQVTGNASITGVVKYSFATLTADGNISATNTNVTGGTNFTLPDATVNAGVEYTIINSTSGTLNINAAMSQLIGNFTTSTTFSMLTETSNTFLSNGTKWLLK